MISQTQTTGGAGQYGFYAVPKAVEPKKKYRDNIDDQYEDEEQEDVNPYAGIDHHELVDEKELERDYYVDQAPYPQFKPRERGLDFGVQIERGDLFDFDLEVKPLIQILVGRSVVSAINELQEEKETDERKNNLDKYQKKRNAELMVTQRLEAKHKRKLEEAERRKLQKELFIKNQKETGKKIIARKNAKETLLGFKNDLFNELEDSGYLRSEPTSDLKIKYEEWLYQKIMEALHFQASSQQVAEKLIKEEERSIKEEHQKAIKAEMDKRQIVLDERAKVERENQERKQKKRARKLRQKMNAQREPDFIKFEQLMERYEQVNSILKFGDRSNGFSRDYASRDSIYIAGGLDNYLLVLLHSSGKDYSSQEIEDMVAKLIHQSGKEFDVPLKEKDFDKVESVKKRMHQNKESFMAQKQGEVKDLAQEISLDLSLMEAAKINIKSTLHRAFLEAILSIYLTVEPEKTQESHPQLSDQDKKRLEIAEKVRLLRQEETFIEKLEKINEILRIHFEIVHSNVHSEASEKKEEEEKKEEGEKKEEEEWIDIFDGEGWDRYAKTSKKQLNKEEQKAAALGLGSFENTFVFDERIFFYLQQQIEKLLEVEGGESLKNYLQNLYNIRGRIKKDVPVYDSEVRWG